MLRYLYVFTFFVVNFMCGVFYFMSEMFFAYMFLLILFILFTAQIIKFMDKQNSVTLSDLQNQFVESAISLNKYLITKDFDESLLKRCVTPTPNGSIVVTCEYPLEENRSAIFTFVFNADTFVGFNLMFYTHKNN